MRLLYIVALWALVWFGRVRGDDDEDDQCPMYCVFQPHPQNPIDYNLYKNLSCTHLIYGFGHVDPYYKITNPSTYDLDEPSMMGNYMKIQYFRSFKNPAKKLYFGLQGHENLYFIDREDTATNVSLNLLEHLRLHNFDGVFFFFNDHRVWTQEMIKFLTIFRREMKNTMDQPNAKNFDILMSVPAQKLPEAKFRLRSITELLDGVYLITDESHATENPNGAVAVDPLHSGDHVPEEDSIENIAAQAVIEGIPAHKLIIGLSTWTRSYRLPKDVDEAHHGSSINGVGPGGNITKRSDGKLAYHEICKMADAASLTYNNDTETVSFVQDRIWYSTVLPNHESLKNKVRWIGNQGFMGIGLSSLASDDKTGKCGHGTFPIHQFVAAENKCKLKRKKRDLTGACTRMCSYKPVQNEKFDYKNFKGEWCSHMLFLSADILISGGVKVSETIKKNFQEYDKWDVDSKPALILSIGDEQPKETWRMALTLNNRRTTTVRSILTLIREYDLDGVDISWTAASPESQQDSTILATFLSELRQSIGTKQLIVSITPQLSYNVRFDAEAISRSVDYILLQGYRFHSYNNIFTGHHSPLFLSSDLLTDPKMTIEGLSFDWVSRGIPPAKLIIGLSAEGMEMYLQNWRTDSSIGAPANVFRNTVGVERSMNAGTLSQSEICEMLKDNTTRTTFIEELGVPYLVRGEEFVAYDDERSIQLKAIWASLNNFGGISLHAIENDNINAECPAGKPFPLLRALVRSQVCNYCGSKEKAKVDKSKTANICNPRFHVACSYKLLQNKTASLTPEKLPFDKCTEIVIEGGAVTASGEVVFPVQDWKQQIAELVKINSQNGDKPLIASIRCNMKDEEFAKVMETHSALTDSIITALKDHKLNGVEFECDHVMKDTIKDKSTTFFNDLQTEVKKLERKNKCPGTTSLRIPVFNTGLNNTYNITLLNELHHVVLESFQTSIDQSQLVSPLFSIGKNPHASIDTTLHQWLEQGLRRDVVIMHIPSYGLMQLLAMSSRADPGLGSETQNDFLNLITQPQICLRVQDPTTKAKVIYDSIASVATTAKHEWISYESQSTITYKMKYAIREGLGGVGLMTLNDEDFDNICKQGAYPLLQTINRNICRA